MPREQDRSPETAITGVEAGCRVRTSYRPRHGVTKLTERGEVVFIDVIEVTLPPDRLHVTQFNPIDHSVLTRAPEAHQFPWGTVVTVHAQAPNTQEIVSTIALLDARKQINIENQVQKTATLKKEGIYFAFPFALEQPQLKYQGATAWIDPVTDMLPGANRQ